MDSVVSSCFDAEQLANRQGHPCLWSGARSQLGLRRGTIVFDLSIRFTLTLLLANFRYTDHLRQGPQANGRGGSARAHAGAAPETAPAPEPAAAPAPEPPGDESA